MSLPDRAVAVGLVEGGLHPLEAEGELAADEDEHLGDLEGVGGDEHALDQLVGIPLDEQVVLEGGRLALVPVDHQVGDRVLAQHGPLAAGGEPGPAPTEQAGGVHLVGHRLGGHGERLAQAVVARRWPGTARGCGSRRGPSRAVTILGASVMAITSRPLACRRIGPLAARPRRPVRPGPSAMAARSEATRSGSASQADGPAHPVEGAVVGDVAGAGAGPELGHQLVEGLGGLGPDEAVVDLHARGPVAVGQALGLLEGDGPVGRWCHRR